MHTYKFSSLLKETKKYANENIENIVFKEGMLEVKANKDVVIEDERAIIPIIMVNTSKDINENEYIEKLKAYKLGIALLSDKIVISSNSLNGKQEIYYSSLFDVELEGKGALLDVLSDNQLMKVYFAFFFTIYIYLFIAYFLTNITDAIILGALGYLFARLLRIKLRYKATFNISIYALTLPIILNLIYIIVNTFTNFEIKYFQWMYTTISYIYVTVAILMIKTEIIQKRIELIKLQEIQKQVIKDTEEEVTNKEKKKEKKEEEEKKEETGEAGEEPEGSKA
ncbi:MAG: DUF1189 domain-containing protein [Clostridia bacterium]|nr:DUF1189 domain-containing protein [Clostridia bacterium]